MKRILFLIVCISLVSAAFAKADVSGKNAKLLQAAKDSNLQAVQASLSGGADVNAKDGDGVTVLMWAAYNGHTGIVKLLLEKGADVNMKRTTDGVTALWMASQKGHTEVVKSLLEKGADVNVKETNTGITALWQASQNGHTEVVKLLLEKGADINVKTTDLGVTALIIASECGHTEVVKLLLGKGADVNVKTTTYGVTALWMASQKDHTEVVKSLLEKGADVNVKETNTGITALWQASQNGHTEIVKLLIEKGADINIKDTYGQTALMMAAYKGHTDVVRLMLEKGADVNTKTNDGKTALDAAKDGGHTDIVQLLEKEQRTRIAAAEQKPISVEGSKPQLKIDSKNPPLQVYSVPSLGYSFVVEEQPGQGGYILGVKGTGQSASGPRPMLLISSNFPVQQVIKDLAAEHRNLSLQNGELWVAFNPGTEVLYFAYKAKGKIFWYGYELTSGDDGLIVLTCWADKNGKISKWYLNMGGAGADLGGAVKAVDVTGWMEFQFTKTMQQGPDGKTISDPPWGDKKIIFHPGKNDSREGELEVVLWEATTFPSGDLQASHDCQYRIRGYWAPGETSGSPFTPKGGRIIAMTIERVSPKEK